MRADCLRASRLSHLRTLQGSSGSKHNLYATIHFGTVFQCMGMSWLTFVSLTSGMLHCLKTQDHSCLPFSIESCIIFITCACLIARRFRHSMKWYCIRPACLPADQVKDMLVPEKCASASVMEGVPELPDGFREATITCLEYIRDVRTFLQTPCGLCVMRCRHFSISNAWYLSILTCSTWSVALFDMRGSAVWRAVCFRG